MTLLQSFRLWSRRAANGERAMAACGVLGAVAVLTWLVVPPHPRPMTLSTAASGPAAVSGSQGAAAGVGQRGTGAQAAAGGGSSATPSVGSSSASGTGSVGGSTAAAAAAPQAVAPGSPQAGATGGQRGSTGTGPSGCLPGNSPGVTAAGIKVAIVLTEIAGAAANSTFGLPSTSEQQNAYQYVIDDTNAHGGIACHKIVPIFFSGDPADQSQLQQTCLQVVQSGAFIAVDDGTYAYFPQKDCYPQNHIPYLGEYIVPPSESQQFYPYLFESQRYDIVYRNSVFALRDRGFFSTANGFSKLGFVYESCYPDLIGKVEGYLAQAGVPSSQTITYDVGCPSIQPSPSDIEQAVLKFQQSGVTHVTWAQFAGGFQSFTTIAQQQGFKPKYGLPDDGLVPLTYGSQKPDYNNLAGAVLISAYRYGEERTPGITPSAATARCNAIDAAHGLPPVYQQQIGIGGIACNDMWILAAAIENSGQVSQTTLAQGLQATRSIDLSYPAGPNDLSAPGNTIYMNFWRTLQFQSACSCWQVIDQTFRPSYP